MNRYVDYKATVWFRIPVHTKEALERVKKSLEKGETPIGIYEDLANQEGIGPCECLFDTEEFMSVKENGNNPTIEIYDSVENSNFQKYIWDNKNGDVKE